VITTRVHTSKCDTLTVPNERMSYHDNNTEQDTTEHVTEACGT